MNDELTFLDVEADDHADDLFTGKKRGITLHYATETELLEFTRKLREAGGVDTLDALLPSQAHIPTQCLIANAVNFSSSVQPVARGQGINPYKFSTFPSGAWQWFMIPGDVDVATLAAAVDCEVVSVFYSNMFYSQHRMPGIAGELAAERLALPLPEKIGNTARAFDLGIGWTRNYRA